MSASVVCVLYCVKDDEEDGSDRVRTACKNAKMMSFFLL